MLNFSKPGWLNDYLTHTKPTKKAINQNFNLDEFIYKSIQPTGLIYGYPIEGPFNTVNNEEKTKSIFIHSIYNIYQTTTPSSKENFLQSLILFYPTVIPKLKKTYSAIKHLPTTTIVEKIIDKRLSHKKRWYHSFISQLFFNNFLYLDLITFALYCSKNLTLEEIHKKREEICTTSLKVIAAAAHADGHIQKEEERLYESFLQSALLETTKANTLKKEFKTQYPLNKINNLSKHRWLVRKFLLDLATLTIWSDKTVEKSETDFLKSLCTHLELSEDEMNHSLMAISGFIIEHYEQVPYFRPKEGVDLLKSKYIDRLSSLMNLNKKRIGQEINESKELVSLLQKSQNHELTEIEKEKVKTQLIDILKTIPLFVIIALPFTFITLPILLSILPKKVLPTAFHDN